ncbi:sigma factor-like helix-turn-helix DNA-binding protein [Streptomyces sp. NPDC056437]|uniref:sigma factor-like helix-turn-helix DNA-binding protein n=1 Tax=Streptomyces sp. NPDC056437 TaxID=3345816 RepID=UPI0036C1346E
MDLVEDFLTLAPLLAQLEDHERQLIRMCFGQKMTQVRIGKELGISLMPVPRPLARCWHGFVSACSASSHQAGDETQLAAVGDRGGVRTRQRWGEGIPSAAESLPDDDSHPAPAEGASVFAAHDRGLIAAMFLRVRHCRYVQCRRLAGADRFTARVLTRYQAALCCGTVHGSTPSSSDQTPTGTTCRRYSSLRVPHKSGNTRRIPTEGESHRDRTALPANSPARSNQQAMSDEHADGRPRHPRPRPSQERGSIRPSVGFPTCRPSGYLERVHFRRTGYFGQPCRNLFRGRRSERGRRNVPRVRPEVDSR